MDARHATLCFLLVLVLHGNPTALAEDCRYRNDKLPLCQDVLCKTQCWLEGAVVNAEVKESRCVGSGPGSTCYCLFCKKD
ncbi:hypothetical protein ZWY2020_035187 [Hordeum vulgare]|uniref:Acidic protein n=1 Tax=Hordeum vulgare subsp. vulgare TaxID=112509 RepID=A0A8I6XID0_HORVV|nr:hypothetical protein ZWY2020_035187 [Hordeum vulgare]